MNKKIITAALLYVCSFSFSMWIQFSCLKQSHVICVCILLAPDFCLFNHYFISFYMMIYCTTLHHIVSYFLSCHNSFQISCSITLCFIKCLIIWCYIILYIIPYYVVSYFMHMHEIESYRFIFIILSSMFLSELNMFIASNLKFHNYWCAKRFENIFFIFF